MGNREGLQTLLETLLGSGNVYFQPPETIKMQYPCIIYSRSKIDSTFANDLPYKHYNRYSITVIDANPDSEIPWKIVSLPLCSFDRHYTANNFNHDVFSLYY